MNQVWAVRGVYGGGVGLGVHGARLIYGETSLNQVKLCINVQFHTSFLVHAGIWVGAEI